MPLNEAQTEALVAELKGPLYDGLNADAGFSLLNDPQTVERKASVAKPLAVADVLGLLEKATVAGMIDNPNLPTILEAIRNQDRAALATWIAALQIGGKLTDADVAALQGAMTATVEQTTTEKIPARVTFAFTIDFGDVAPGPPENPNAEYVALRAKALALSGMPNRIKRPDFDAAWTAAGRV